MISIHFDNIYMHRITGFINRLSFSRKLAFTFFICSLLTFAVIDVIMHVLYSTVVSSTKSDSTFNTQAFSQFSNNEILRSSEAYLQSGLDLYEQIMTQTFTTFFYFQQHSDIYTSNQVRGKNPKECSVYKNLKYDRSCVFFYTQNSTFYDHPFFDKVIASSATQHYPSSLKRINIIYQSRTNPEDIMVRTVPATSDFHVPNSDNIAERINTSIYGRVTFSDWYFDQFSISNNKTKLVSLRILVSDLSDYDILIEIEVIKYILDYALTNIYSFPSTKVVLVKIIQNGYSFLGQNTLLPSSLNISDFLQPGQRNISIQNSPFLVTTQALVDDNNDLNQVGQILMSTDSTPTDMRMIIFLNKTQTQLPNIIYKHFTQNQYGALVFLLYGWTFLILLFVLAIGVVIGDLIFSYFSLVRRKCKQYLYNPAEIKNIDLEIKDDYDYEKKNRQLFENITSIMQGIENKKVENKKNYRITYDTFPLNRMGMNFQKKMKIRDYNKFEAIAKIIKQKQQQQKHS